MRITIVGLGIVGQSIGLALKQVAPKIEVIGHDPEAALVKSARSAGAIDKSHWNLVSACEGADIILLDVPLSQLPLTLDAIAPDLGESTVTADLLPIKTPVMEMAKEHLPASANFCGAHLTSPATLALDGPAADWLTSATFYLVASAAVAPEAMDKMVNLAEAVGAKPQFISAAEHDGLVAAMDQLPALASIALLDTLSSERGSRDRANAVGVSLAAHATAAESASVDGSVEWLANGNNVTRWLDVYINHLSELRQALADADEETLKAASERASSAASEWMGHQTTHDESALPRVNPWRSMFLGGLSFRRHDAGKRDDTR